MGQLLGEKCEKALIECITKYSHFEYTIDISFAVQFDETVQLIFIFENLPDKFERICTKRLLSSIQDSILKNKLEAHSCKFNIRIFDKSVFLYSIAKFDPDILNYFVRDVHMLVGKDYYNSLKENFFHNNANPAYKSILIPYVEDVFLSWTYTHEKYVAFDVQITRSLLNGLKLFYIIHQYGNQIPIQDLVKLTDVKKLQEVLESVNFIIDKPEINFTKKKLLNAFFVKSTANIFERQILAEEFLSQLLDWLLRWLEQYYSTLENKSMLKIYEMVIVFIKESNMYNKYKFNLEKIDTLLKESSGDSADKKVK